MGIDEYIESYEPYHIGSKIASYVNNRSLATKIYEHFEKKEENNIDLNEEIFSRESLLSPVVNILTKKKEKVAIQLNLAANALNVVGNKPNDVYELSQELVKALPELGFELISTFLYYEIITNIN